MRLVVAIPTFKRAARLAQLLPLVGSQLAELRSTGMVSESQIFVVDNDPEASARSVVEPSYSGSATRYIVELTPGIPAVRNRALDEAETFDLLSFIDDDEIPLDGWIRSLVETWRTSGKPAAVMGRVVSIWADDVDPWIVASGAFSRPQMPTGTEISVAATGNLLLDLAQVRESRVRFDERIGLGGGSDTLFSMSLKRTGVRMVWCNESVTEDTVELARQTRKWLCKRAYSHGNIFVFVRLRLESDPRRRVLIRAKGTAGGIARVIVGCARTSLGWLVQSNRHRARGLRLCYRGAGMISASLGRSFAAYARSQPSSAVA